MCFREPVAAVPAGAAVSCSPEGAAPLGGRHRAAPWCLFPNLWVCAAGEQGAAGSLCFCICLEEPSPPVRVLCSPCDRPGFCVELCIPPCVASRLCSGVQRRPGEYTVPQVFLVAVFYRFVSEIGVEGPFPGRTGLLSLGFRERSLGPPPPSLEVLRGVEGTTRLASFAKRFDLRRWGGGFS